MKVRYEAVLYLKVSGMVKATIISQWWYQCSTERSSETIIGQFIADADSISLNNDEGWSFAFDNEMNDDDNLYSETGDL